ncbi:MAG: CPBP family intramembrane glutamic endopeptidase [Verrucomicrobiota bacterium]|nr:CPBP family intramembrane glutamic endopeptidase [Verrucomicrobiota bacterium]
MSGSFDISELALAHPFFFFYAGGLLLGGLIFMGLIGALLFMRSEWRGCHVERWGIPWHEFARYLGFAAFWILSQQVLMGVVVSVFPTLDADVLGVIGSFSMQLGLVALFIVFRMQQTALVKDFVNTRHPNLPLSLVTGFALFMAAFPLIGMVGIGWQALLLALRNYGFDIPMETQDIVALFGEETNPWMFGSLLFLAVVMAPVSEELLFRAGIYRFLKGKLPLWAAMLISSALFSSLHLNVLGFPSLMTVGICLCLVYELTGNIRVAIIFHAIFNLNSIILITLMPEELQVGMLHFSPWVW